MIDIFGGIVIRLARRLNEFFNQGMCRHPCSSLHSSRVVSPLEHRVMSETLLGSHNLFLSRSTNISSRSLSDFQPMLQDSSVHQDLSNSSFQSPVIMNKLSQIMGDSRMKELTVSCSKVPFVVGLMQAFAFF
ncbi:hypothetical protein MKW98_031502 [Papaver atlanticum]|uniref:Uncharacterized protein n=1 Tax=Papaver atlanticum TaxID=357466 RepID=A0AAD4S611_9MAGN|nr:hypothetical protein MKW98_031502 [Papaver atlanticum]